MTQGELLLRLLLLAKDVQENSLLFRTRVRHQRRFHAGEYGSRRQVVHGTMLYYKEESLAAMRYEVSANLQLANFMEDAKDILDAPQEPLNIGTTLPRLGDLHALAAKSNIVPVTVAFKRVMDYFRNVRHKD